MADFALPALPRVLPEALVRGRRRTASFGDLVNARGSDGTGSGYAETRERFEAEHGKIVDDYWPTREGTGLALCCKRVGWGREQWSLHRSMGDLAATRPDFSPLLLHVARESVRASNVLSGMTQRIAVSNLFSLSRDIMASLDSTGRRRPSPQAYLRNLHDISAYAAQAGARQAQIVYLKGLMGGLLALVLLAPVLALALPSAHVPGLDPRLFVGCLVAGSTGATMSVLMRMSGGKFDVNHEVGREYVTRLGFARPYIGAVFALLLYFAFQGGLLQQVHVPDSPGGAFAFFVAAGFLIGFSERFAKDIVRSAESGAGGTQPALGAAADAAGAKKQV
jgi:hypothetical protein